LDWKKVVSELLPILVQAQDRALPIFIFIYLEKENLPGPRAKDQVPEMGNPEMHKVE
jgi:hypothetical protein